MGPQQGTHSVLGVVGLGLLVVGTIKALSSSGDSGGIILLIVGALLLLSPFILGRLGSFDFSLTRWTQPSRNTQSDDKTEQVPDRAELVKFAESYAFVHEELNDPRHLDAKAYLQDLLVQRASAVSRREKLDAAEIRTLFKDSSPVLRVLALGLMQGDPSLADGTTIISAIADSRTANEQFQGLKLALLCWHNLERGDRHAIQSATSGSPQIQPGTDRQSLADQVLALSA